MARPGFEPTSQLSCNCSRISTVWTYGVVTSCRTDTWRMPFHQMTSGWGLFQALLWGLIAFLARAQCELCVSLKQPWALLAFKKGCLVIHHPSTVKWFSNNKKLRRSRFENTILRTLSSKSQKFENYLDGMFLRIVGQLADFFSTSFLIVLTD